MYQMFNWRLSRVSDCRNYNERQSNNVVILIFKTVLFVLIINVNILVRDNQKSFSGSEGSKKLCISGRSKFLIWR